MREAVFLGHGGERIVYRPAGETFNVQPLGFQELVAGVVSSAPKFEIEFSDVEIRESSIGPVPNELMKVKKSFTYWGRVEFFGLVLGGWLPLPWAHKQTAWVDRNIISELRKFLARGTRPSWASGGVGLGQDSNRVSPVLYAMEGGWQRKPTFDEMNEALDEGVDVLRKVLPTWQVDDPSEQMRRALFQELERLNEIAQRSKALLVFGAPLVSQPVRKTKQRHVEVQILKRARETGASMLAALALLSCLYDNAPNLPRNRVYRPGRAVLKPSGLLAESGLYNALADISHIELMLGAIAAIPNYQPALYTRDVGLAALWTALSPNNPSLGPGAAEGLVAPRWNLQLTPALLPALSPNECAALGRRLQSR